MAGNMNAVLQILRADNAKSNRVLWLLPRNVYYKNYRYNRMPAQPPFDRQMPAWHLFYFRLDVMRASKLINIAQSAILKTSSSASRVFHDVLFASNEMILPSWLKLTNIQALQWKTPLSLNFAVAGNVQTTSRWISWCDSISWGLARIQKPCSKL